MLARIPPLCCARSKSHSHVLQFCVLTEDSRTHCAPSQGFGASFGEALGDAWDAAKQGASDLSHHLQRNEIVRDLGRGAAEVGEIVKETAVDLSERVGHEWDKATNGNEPRRRDRGGQRSPEQSGSRRMTGNMPRLLLDRSMPAASWS